MPDKASGNRYGSRDSDFCSEEISSIGMSIRPSGSASSGEFIHNSYWSQKFTYLCIFQIYLFILKTLPILCYFIFSFKHISLLIFKYIFCPYNRKFIFDFQLTTSLYSYYQIILRNSKKHYTLDTSVSMFLFYFNNLRAGTF